MRISRMLALAGLASAITPVHAQTVYVDPNGGNAACYGSWDDAATDLWAVLDAIKAQNPPSGWGCSGPITEVRVAKATFFTHAGSPTYSFELPDGVKVRGGFLGLAASSSPHRDDRDAEHDRTTLTADLGNGERANHIVTADSVGSSTLLECFYVIPAVPEDVSGSGCSYGDDTGGSVLITNASPKIDRCDFIGGTKRAGGAIAIYNGEEVDRVPIARSAFLKVYAGDGGAIYVGSGSTAIVSCFFFNGEANVETGNGFGGAIFISPNVCGDPLASSHVIANCVFKACEGSGKDIYSESNDVTVVNCTFPPGEADYAILNNGTMRIANSIIWTGASGAVMVGTGMGASTTVVYSDTSDVSGTGDINTDPLFGNDIGPCSRGIDTSDTSADILSSGSPCLDAGSNSELPADYTDLDGDTNSGETLPMDYCGRGRVLRYGGAVDMGATERPVACYPNCDGSTTVPFLNVADFSCFLNAFSAGSFYADCNGNGILEVTDFGCFLNSMSAGCSAP